MGSREERREDSLAAFTASSNPDDQALLRALIGHTARGADAGSDTHKAVKELVNDPTPRRTLKWTIAAAIAAILTLVATIVIPSCQAAADRAKESEHKRAEDEARRQAAERQRAVDEKLRIIIKQTARTPAPARTRNGKRPSN